MSNAASASSFTRGIVPDGPVPLAYLDTGGDGFPVVLLHGVMGRGACWATVMKALARRHRCIALDRRGHGRSGKPEAGYERADHVADLERLVTALGLERFALIGHSTGAIDAWVYAARNPARVAAAILEDGRASGRGSAEVASWRSWFGSWPMPFPTRRDAIACVAAARPALADYFAELFEERDDGWWPLFRVDAVLQTVAGNELRDWWDELAGVTCPALVVNGRDSDYLDLGEAEKMAGALARGHLAVVAGAGHTVHSDQPQAYIHVVDRFLAEVLPGADGDNAAGSLGDNAAGSLGDDAAGSLGDHAAGADGAPAPSRWDDVELEIMARAQYGEGRADLPLDPARAALLLIDMQEEFTTVRGGPYRVPAAARRIPAMAELLRAFRLRRRPVIHTVFAATHHLLDRPRWGASMPNRAAGSGFDDSLLFQEGRIVPELVPRADEVVIRKPSYGAFHDTPLETILKRLEVEAVVLAGTLTDCCVGTTARQAYERGFAVFVVSDATATSLPEMHEAELKILRRSFARIVTTREVVAIVEPN